MTTILTELDRALDAWNSKSRAEANRRRSLSDGVYAGHRRRALADPRTHPLKRNRLLFRGHGLRINELADRALVAASTIKALEHGQPGSDLTWQRLTRALDLTNRAAIDPSWLTP